MKWRAALAALLLLASSASAKTYDVVVIAQNPASNVTLETGLEIARLNHTYLDRILRMSGTDYLIIPQTLAYTDYARRGLFPRTGGVTDSARCVIISSFQASVGRTGTFRADSLMRVAMGGMQVPLLALIDNTAEIASGSSPHMDDDPSAARRCTTGVSGTKLNNATMFPYTKSDPTLRWRFCSYLTGYSRNLSQSPVGGLRVVLGGSLPAFKQEATGATNSQFPCSMPGIDQAGVSAGADSILVWDRLWANIASAPNAKPMTFVSWGGAGYNNNDSLTTVDYGYIGQPDEVGLDVLLYGLAHFDSLTLAQTGRRLIFGNMKSPRKLALTVDGGLARNLRRLNIGIQGDDTTSFYSTLDSLRLANIPFTLGVNVDSASAYARDIIKFRENGNIRFSPQVWTAVMDTSAAGLTTARFRDILGRWRNRPFVGPGTFAGADSSIYSGLLKARAVCDSLFPGRQSRFLLPPMDDYSPLNLRPYAQSNPGGYSSVDSLLYAVRAAGFTGIRINGKYTDSDARYRGAFQNPKGWHAEAGKYRNAIDGKWLTMLQHNGYELQGGISWANSMVDSVAPYDSSAVGRMALERPLFGMWNMDGAWDSDVLGNLNPFAQDIILWRDVKHVYEDRQDPQFPYTAQARYTRAQVYTMSCSDLSGRQPDPARTGWLTIRWLDSIMKAVNAAAGKSIMTWAYPEDIEP